MHKYSQLKKFNHDRQLQVYMYNFMYVFPQKMPVEDHFPATKTFIVNYKKMYLREQDQNIGLYLVIYVQKIMC